MFAAKNRNRPTETCSVSDRILGVDLNAPDSGSVGSPGGNPPGSIRPVAANYFLSLGSMNEGELI